MFQRSVPAALLALFLLSACGVSPTAVPEAAAVDSTAPPEPTDTPTSTAIPLTPTPTELYPGEGPWPVTFDTADGVTLSGIVYGKTGTLGVVMAPTYPGGQDGWAGFAAKVAAQGYRALTFDLRGHGDSGGDQDITQAVADVQAAMSFLRGEETERIVLLGAGEGGSAVIKATADPSVVGVAVISAMKGFEGLNVSDAELQAITVPSVWLAARLDLFQEIEPMSELAGSADKEVWIYEGSSLHGTYIFEGSDGPDMTGRLLALIDRVAGDS